MKWKKFRITTTTAAEDLVSGMLIELGIDGVQVEDNVQLSDKDTKAMFIDILPELPPDEGIGYVSFYIDEADATDELMDKVRNGLDDLKDFVDVGACTIEESETEDKDWVNNWKEYFKPFMVKEVSVLLVDKELTVPDDMQGRMVVNIDPGTAFGTGMHETTQLVIKQLEKYVTPETELLDVGTGSGILAVIAKMLGAKSIIGTDLDENAITASAENMEANGFAPDIFKVIQGNIIDDKAVQDEVGYEKYDVVTANILADVIMPLSKEIAQHIKHGGVFITSGIIDMKEDAVKKTIMENPELEIVDVSHQGDWVSITAVRKQTRER